MIKTEPNDAVLHEGSVYWDAMIRELDKRFTCHEIDPLQTMRADTFRNKARDIAEYLFRFVPESRERALALTKLEEAVMWGVAGIARNG